MIAYGTGAHVQIRTGKMHRARLSAFQVRSTLSHFTLQTSCLERTDGLAPSTASAGSFQQMSSCGNGGIFVCSYNATDCTDNTKLVSPGIPVPYAIPSSGGASKITPFGVAITSHVSLSTTTVPTTSTTAATSNLHTGGSTTTTTTNTTTTTPTVASNATSNSNSSGLAESDEIGIGLGVTFSVVASISAIAFVWRRRRANKNFSRAGPNQFGVYEYPEMQSQSRVSMGISPEPVGPGALERRLTSRVEANHDERRLELPPHEERGATGICSLVKG